MAFRSWDAQHLARFNSSTASDFLDMYENYVDEKILEKAAQPSHKTFAASSFRCDRRSWFRLRGVQPDVPSVADRQLNFTAEIGTACHRIIQNNLKEALKDNWIDVQEYINSIDFPYEYELNQDDDGLESQLEIKDPPIRFACDGILRINEVNYLLEIKTSEYSSWQDLTDPKAEHVDQIKCYATLLKLNHVLFLYQDRQYGDLKCYEVTVSDFEQEQIIKRFQYVVDMVNKNLAPGGLPKGDKWCSPSMCAYYKKCQEYGR